MGAFANKDELVERLTGGSSGNPQRIEWFRDVRIAGAAPANYPAGRWNSLWRFQGVPSAAAAPGAVAAPTNATDGALKQTDPSGGRQLWLTGGTVEASLGLGTLLLYDRLLHISGFSGTVTTPQNVGGALTRYTGAASVGNRVFIEIYTLIGATPTTITMSYTDQDGNAKTSRATAIGGTGRREANMLIPLSLDDGDTGVRGVTSVTLAGTTGTAGDFGVTVARPLLMFPTPTSGVVPPRNLFIEPPLVEVLSGACLAFAAAEMLVSLQQFSGHINLVER